MRYSFSQKRSLYTQPMVWLKNYNHKQLLKRSVVIWFLQSSCFNEILTYRESHMHVYLSLRSIPFVILLFLINLGRYVLAISHISNLWNLSQA